MLVRDINPGSDGSSLLDLTNVAGTLFFRADDNATGRELWLSDGTLFFIADSGSGPGLWKSNGTTAGTVLVDDDFASGTAIAPPDNLVDGVTRNTATEDCSVAVLL